MISDFSKHVSLEEDQYSFDFVEDADKTPSYISTLLSVLHQPVSTSTIYTPLASSNNVNLPYNASYTNAYITLTSTTTTVSTSNSYSGAIKISGDAEVTGDLKIKGISLFDRLSAIERKLAILRPNPTLEEKWEKLKKLGDEYRELEAEILEQQNMWDIIKN